MGTGGLLVGVVLGGADLRAQTPAASVPAEVRHYVVYRVTPGITVDGRLDEDVWRATPRTEPFMDIRGEKHPQPTHETRARLLWDNEYLYVAARLEEPHLWATLTERDAIIYRDHDFEVFLDPDGDGLAYYEFEVNALGTMFDLFLDRPYSEGGAAHIDWDARGLWWAVHLEGTLNDPSDRDKGWSVEMAIPWRALRPPEDVGAIADTERMRDPGPPEDGDLWRVNFSRVQWPLVIEEGVYRKEREPVDFSDHPEDNWVWSPQGAVDMHIPSRWGVVRFRAAPPPGSDE